MTPELTSQLAAGLLLSGLLTVLAVGILISCLVLLWVRRHHAHRVRRVAPPKPVSPAYRPSLFEQTCRWLVVKSTHVGAVQAALGLHNPVPCSWGEGLSHLSGRKLFVAPPVRGWILVVGQGLPDPSDDIDACFHFLVRLSRALGQVQFFSFNRAVNHHAWMHAERGGIRRAYAWGGETLWNQGKPTPAEMALDLSLLDYGEVAGPIDLLHGDSVVPNAEKVTALAARWSFDPTAVNESALRAGLGVAGDLTGQRQR